MTSTVGVSMRPRRSRFKKILYRPEAVLLAALSLALRPLTLANQLRVGAALGRLAWLVSPRRDLSIDNARRALGVGEDEARRVARAAHLHLGRSIVEFLTARSYLEPERAASLEVEHFEHLQRAYDEGEGVIVATAHLGNWELLGVKQALEGVPLLVLGREPKNPFVARRLEATRRLCGNQWLPTNRGLLRAVKGLKAGRCLGTAIDQHTRSNPKITSEFLGRPAVLSTVVFELAVRLGCPVVPCVTIPKAGGGYRLVYHPPLRASKTGDRDERVRELAGRCHRVVESWIRERPGTWFWFHDLWKGVPNAVSKGSVEGRSSTLEA